MNRPGKQDPRRKLESNPGFVTLGADAVPLGQGDGVCWAREHLLSRVVRAPAAEELRSCLIRANPLLRSLRTREGWIKSGGDCYSFGVASVKSLRQTYSAFFTQLVLTCFYSKTCTYIINR